jgi:hypothetical protein
MLEEKKICVVKGTVYAKFTENCLTERILFLKFQGSGSDGKLAFYVVFR